MTGTSSGTLAPAQIHVAHGRATGCQGIRFGGMAHIPATADAPAWVRVAVRYENGELRADLREGDTLDLPGQTWRLDRIRADGRNWHASLTHLTRLT